jgi:protein-L-isoaspartate(D-aspartate) O-methyltransferase
LASNVIVARSLAATVVVALLAVSVAGCSDDGNAPTLRRTNTPPSGNLLTPVAVLPDPNTRTSVPEEDDTIRVRRQRMVDEDIAARGVRDSRVVLAMATVPRHILVQDKHQDKAYDDGPLPIGYGQTISQPYTVGLMTELLSVGPGDKVLEVGTGSGYQSAVLAEMGVEVHTIEIIPELAQRAANDLLTLGYDNVNVYLGDGYFGLTEHGPFDGIIVTAAPDHVPAPLLEQLKPTGRMVVPVGPPGSIQTLWLIMFRDGNQVARNQGLVRFVPLLRD